MVCRDTPFFILGFRVDIAKFVQYLKDKGIGRELTDEEIEDCADGHDYRYIEYSCGDDNELEPGVYFHYDAEVDEAYLSLSKKDYEPLDFDKLRELLSNKEAITRMTEIAKEMEAEEDTPKLFPGVNYDY